VDLGAGNGRDALWFAGQGRSVIAVDYSMGEIGRAAKRAARRKLTVSFESLNFSDTREVLALGTRLARTEAPVDLYGRFLLHSLEGLGRQNILRLASMTLRRGGLLLLEFRTTEDARRHHHFKQRTRQYLDPADVVAMIEARGGRVLHRSAGTGLASFEDEDPHVCRIVATWIGPDPSA
jgi:hypothetical protein